MKPQRQGQQWQGLNDLIQTLPNNLIGVEIGSYAGESAEMFMQSGKFTKLYCIDPWLHVEYAKEAEQAFDKRINGLKVVKLKGTIKDFIDRLPPVDFAYIDGEHEYNSVKTDIIQMLKVVNKGGIIAGHDYAPKYNDHVVKAVLNVLGLPDRVFCDSSWVVKI